MHETLLYQKLSGKKVRCGICQRSCVINPGGTGFCQTRVNKNGQLYTTIYGIISGADNDPIEKKPVFHFMPGSKVFSLGTFGCNFKCKFCQNYDQSFANFSEISLPTSTSSFTPLTSHFPSKPESYLSPEEAVTTAIKLKSQGIAFTYNEPIIWLEYVLEVIKLAKSVMPNSFRHPKGILKQVQNDKLYTVLVTNGYGTKKAIDLIAPYLDIYRVDLKSFDDNFYQKLIGIPKAEVIFSNTKYLHDHYPKIHLECVTNIIPGWNDSEENLSQIAQWIVKNLGELTPWHVTAYHPALANPQLPDYSTPLKTLIKAQKIGKEAGLAFVYLGNVATKNGENTSCPKCQTLNIERNGYQIKFLAVVEKKGRGYCQNCGQDLNLIL